MIKTIVTNNPDTDPKVAELLDLLRSGSLVSMNTSARLDVAGIVADIIEKIKTGGDEAVLELTARLDRAELRLENLRISESELQEAHKKADPEFLGLVRKAAANVRVYQEQILLKNPESLRRGGRTLGLRYNAIERAAVYVPGGKALYPSTVLMTVIPAQVAGVKELVLTSPPTGGDVDPMVKALAWELGIREVYRMGGAVAIAALAFGTKTIRAVSKIVGPGNAFVAEAKRRVFGRVGIDSVAGPSEVCILADRSADPEYLASDLIAQAEHDPGSGILVTTDAAIAADTVKALERIVETLSRKAEILNALNRYSAIFVVPDLDTGISLVNQIASEHLQIVVENCEAAIAKITNAGAIFIGKNTPVPIGDYWAGPSHVLPTGGGAKFFGPLSCNDFLKATSLIEYDKQSIKEDAAEAAAFARLEGLDGHALALEKRL